jgi:hypothetical protein
MERVTNAPWKQLCNYTVIDADWNLIIPYRVSKLIHGVLKKILDYQTPVTETAFI